MNKYKVLFSQTFKDMFKYQFDKYKSYSPTYALNIKKKLKVLDNTIYLLYFIDGRQSPKNYFKIYKN